MEDTNKTKAWLGIATGVISVLAFFGVTNFEQIRNFVDPGSAHRVTCKQAREADRVAHQDVSAYADKVLAVQLRHAADATKDAQLQTALRFNADAADQFADAMARQEGHTLPPSVGNQIRLSRNSWIERCTALKAW